jgi:hypothetical protein
MAAKVQVCLDRELSKPHRDTVLAQPIITFPSVGSLVVDPNLKIPPFEDSYIVARTKALTPVEKATDEVQQLVNQVTFNFINLTLNFIKNSRFFLV